MHSGKKSREKVLRHGQSLPALIIFNKSRVVEVASLHKLTLVANLLFSKYPNSIFAHRKLIPKCDQWKLDNFKLDQFIKGNQPVISLIDTVQHKTSKISFGKPNPATNLTVYLPDRKPVEMLGLETNLKLLRNFNTT